MVRVRHVLLTIAGLCTITPSVWSTGSGGPGGDEQSMKLVVPPKWEFIVPNETPLALAADSNGNLTVPIPHAGGAGFIVAKDGTALGVDCNGDGKVDEKVKGIGGSVVLKGKTADGASFSYAVRFVNNAGTWQYLPGGAMSGKLLGEDFKVIDRNGNGRYDDFGLDAMILGSRGTASFLSKTVSIGGKLYGLTVSASGDSVKAEPLSGETGTLNALSGFKSDGGEAVSAVVTNAEGDVSFEVAGNKNGLVVPAGEYKFVWGFVKKGGETSKVRGTANCKPITVEAGKSASLAWGGPLEMDFEFEITKDRIKVPPTVKFFGQGGEEYYEFKPDAKSPKIVVFDPETKQVVVEGRFGGC